MVNGQIHYARLPIELDSNSAVIDLTVGPSIFPTGNYDIVESQIVPISGGSGKSNAVMVVIARRIN